MAGLSLCSFRVCTAIVRIYMKRAVLIHLVYRFAVMTLMCIRTSTTVLAIPHRSDDFASGAVAEAVKFDYMYFWSPSTDGQPE